MNKLNLETVQFKNLTDIDDVVPLNENDAQVLREVREILIKHNYTERFGITLLHKHFEVDEDEMLLETTDEKNRISTVKVERADEVSDTTIGTMWKFSNDDEKISMNCVIRCFYDYEEGYHRKVHRNE